MLLELVKSCEGVVSYFNKVKLPREESYSVVLVKMSIGDCFWPDAQIPPQFSGPDKTRNRKDAFKLTAFNLEQK